MVEDTPGNALFANDAMQLFRQIGLDDHVRKTVRGVRNFKQVSEFAARLADGDKRGGTTFPLGFINHLAQFGCKLAVAETRFMSCDLQGDGHETVVVSVDVGFYEGLELAAAGHYFTCRM